MMTSAAALKAGWVIICVFGRPLTAKKRSFSPSTAAFLITIRSTRHGKRKVLPMGDITLHFLIFDVLSGPDIALPLNGIMDEIDRRLSCFDEPKTFDASTVRKKLKEYAEQGLICVQIVRKTLLYRRAATAQPACTDALDFFPEVAPRGVIGSFFAG